MLERAALKGGAAGVIASAAEHDRARARDDDAAGAGAVVEIGRVRTGLVADRTVDCSGLAAGLAGAEGDALIALQEDAGTIALARSGAARSGAAARGAVGERAAADRQRAALHDKNVAAGAEAATATAAGARSTARPAGAAVTTIAASTASAAGGVARFYARTAAGSISSLTT